MPTYQYKREDGTIFEVFQSMSEDALTHCPETGQPVKRMITGGSGVVYKGSGWYVTDYKNGPAGKKPESEATPAPESKAEKTTADTD